MRQAVRRRGAEASLDKLVEDLKRFIQHLRQQNEDEAVEALTDLCGRLEEPAAVGDVLRELEAAFEEHELHAYTLKRDLAPDNWSPADEIFVSSTKVLGSLTRLTKLYR